MKHLIPNWARGVEVVWILQLTDFTALNGMFFVCCCLILLDTLLFLNATASVSF